MTHAYEETYLDDAINNLGEMIDYAVCDCKYEADEFFAFFLSSGIAKEFEQGNPKYVAGMSGVELASEVIYRVYGKYLSVPATQAVDKSPEFWSGWILAYYQWFSGNRFSHIHAVLKIADILELYPTLHEADISKFVNIANCRMAHHWQNGETALAYTRKLKGMPQRELAEKSGVALRMIQLYEQRQNNINKAQVSTLLAVAKVLHCEIEDLMEPTVQAEA